MRLHPARPRGIPLLVLTALALTTVGLAAPATAAPLGAAPSVTADDVCTADPSTRPVGVYELTAVEDAGVGIWAGGGLTVTTATELEGRVVVGGDADLSGAGSLNVGTAGGGGSAITPAGGTDMLVVGGDLATATNTQVGFHASSGGHVVVGGEIVGARPSTANFHGGPAGTVTQGVGRDAALRPYAALPALVTGLATDAADGAVAARPQGGVLTLEAGARYTLTAAQASTLTTLYVTGTGPVLLTVTGSVVDVSGLKHVEYGGVRVYQDTQYLSAHFLWSFPDATQVTLGTNDQFPGTVVVPRTDATLTVATSTNGRILSNGAVSYTGGAGIEHHNYPFAGPCETTPLVEEPQPEPSPEGPNPGEGVTTPPTSEETPVAEEPGEPSTEPTPAAETSATPSPEATHATAEPGDETPESGLATTGASVVVLAVVAALLLGGGATILVVARRATS